MPEPTTPPAAAEPPVQPSNTEPPVQSQEQQQEQAPKVVTEEALVRILDERDRRLKQGNKDRAKEIDKRFEDMRTEFANRGTPLTKEQEATVRATVETQYDQAQEQGSTQPQANADDLHPLAQLAFPIMDEEGVTVEEGDPEFETLKPYLDKPQLTAPDVAKFTRELYKAIDAKRERTTSSKEKAAARANGATGSQSGQRQIKSARDAWQEAYKPK